MKKVISIILACIFAFSAFCVNSFAIESASPEAIAKLLKEYEECVALTAKKGLLKANIAFENSKEADYRPLTDADKKLTELRDSDKYTSFGGKEEYIQYFDSSNKTEFKDIAYEFSAESYIKSFFLDKNDAAKVSEGNRNFYIFECSDSTGNELWEFNIYTNAKTGLLDSFSLAKTFKTYEKSALGKEYPIVEYSKITYDVEYQLVAPKSLELSKDNITLTYKDTTEIEVKISPDNATFKDFYYVIAYEDGDLSSDMVIYETSNGSGTIKVTAVGKGITELRVYTADGKCYDTCKITVEFDFFDYFRFFFDRIIENVQKMFNRV